MRRCGFGLGRSYATRVELLRPYPSMYFQLGVWLNTDLSKNYSIHGWIGVRDEALVTPCNQRLGHAM